MRSSRAGGTQDIVHRNAEEVQVVHKVQPLSRQLTALRQPNLTALASLGARLQIHHIRPQPPLPAGQGKVHAQELNIMHLLTGNHAGAGGNVHAGCEAHAKHAHALCKRCCLPSHPRPTHPPALLSLVARRRRQRRMQPITRRISSAPPAPPATPAMTATFTPPPLDPVSDTGVPAMPAGAGAGEGEAAAGRGLGGSGWETDGEGGRGEGLAGAGEGRGWRGEGEAARKEGEATRGLGEDAWGLGEGGATGLGLAGATTGLGLGRGSLVGGGEGGLVGGEASACSMAGLGDRAGGGGGEERVGRITGSTG